LSASVKTAIPVRKKFLKVFIDFLFLKKEYSTPKALELNHASKKYLKNQDLISNTTRHGISLRGINLSPFNHKAI